MDSNKEELYKGIRKNKKSILSYPKKQPAEIRAIEDEIISLIKKGNTVPIMIDILMEKYELPRHKVYGYLKSLESEGIIIKKIRAKKGYIELDATYELKTS